MNEEFMRELIAAVIDLHNGGQINPDTLNKIKEWHRNGEPWDEDTIDDEGDDS